MANYYAFSIFVLAITSSVYSVYGQDGYLFDSEKYPPEPVCKKVNMTVYQSHYTIVKLKCQWRKYLNYMKEKVELVNKENEKKTILDKKPDDRNVKVEKKNTLFDIEFENTIQEVNPSIDINAITEDLFSLFRLYRLSAPNLQLNRIDVNTFSKCCENLEILDLSKNDLVRIDKELLKPLKNLKDLNLAANKLQVENKNFEYNTILETINLHKNNIQYLPEKLFYGNERLKKIDISENGFKNFDACMFSSLKSYGTDANYVKKTTVTAHTNPIDCDCELFYLVSQPKIGFDLICHKPDFYKNRHIDDLVNEKPDKVKCSFEAIKQRCNPEEADSKVPIIVLSVLLGVFVLLTLLACCQVASLTSKLRRNRNRSTSVPHHQNPPKEYKVLSTVDHKE